MSKFLKSTDTKLCFENRIELVMFMYGMVLYISKTNKILAYSVVQYNTVSVVQYNTVHRHTNIHSVIHQND